MIVEHGLISFLQKFDEQPFLVKMGGKEYKIGEGEPTFTVKFNKSIPLSDLLTSTYRPGRGVYGRQSGDRRRSV